MKNFYLVIAILFLLSFAASAQAPNQLNYQGVARDASGVVLPNQNISLRFTIHQGTAGGTTVYQETKAATTNQLGLFTVAIGSGVVVSGTFSTIGWGTNAEYLQVEMDPTGGTSYLNMGTNQFLSVPYALNAGSSSSGWNLTGNTGITNPAAPATYGTSNFGVSENWMGTTDTKDLTFGTKNIERMRIGGGSVATAGYVGIGTAAPNALLTLAGPVSSTYGASEQLFITGNAYPVMEFFNYGHSNSSINFDCFFDGSTWRSSVANNSYQIYSNLGQFQINYANSTVNGNIGSTGLTVGLTLNGSTGNVGIGIAAATPAQKLEVGGATQTIRDDGLASTASTFNVAPTLATDRIMYANAAGDIKSIPAVNSAILVTSATGIPSWSTAGVGTDWHTTGNATGAYTYSATPTSNVIGTTSAGGGGIQFEVEGQNAGRIEYNLVPSQMTALGWEALNSATGQGNTAFGFMTGMNISSGAYNVAMGYFALAHQSNTLTGSDNTAIGDVALTWLTGSSSNNTAVGYRALANSATTGSTNNNTAVGSQSQFENSSGSPNTAVGFNSLYTNTIGGDNVAMGYQALYNTNTTTAGQSSFNTAVGDNALMTNATGTYNTSLGYNADATSAALTNATAIGANASVSTSNTVILGSNAVTQVGFNGALAPYYGGVYNTGLSGQVLTSTGAGAPQWQNAAGGGTATTDSLLYNPTENTISGNGSAGSPLRIARDGATSAQVLQWNGTSWKPATISGGVGDNWGTQAVVTDATLTGNGVSGTPLGIAQHGATSGQALVWNGSTWLPGTVASSSGWNLTGNTGITNPAAPATYGTSNFGVSENWVGTTDTKDLTFGTKNIERMRIGGGSVATAGYVGIGTAAPNALLTLAGPVSSTYGASEQLFITGNAYPVMEFFNYGHSNSSINFDCFFDGSTWRSSVANNSYQIYSNLGQFQINYANSTVNGNIGSTGLTVGFTLNGSTGNVGIGIAAATPAQKLEVGGATQTIRDDGLASTASTFNVAPTLATDRIMYANAAGDIKSIPAVNSAILVTSATGIPSWSTAGVGTDWHTTGNATGTYTFSATPTSNVIGTTSAGGGGIQFEVEGQNAGRIEYNLVATQMTALGWEALNSATGQGNTAFGFTAGQSISSGAYNVAMGYFALAHQAGTLTGSNNTAIGDVALTWLTGTSSNNTAVGYRALANSATTGSTNNNTAVGSQSQFENSSGSPNTAVGFNSLYNNTIGSDNVAMGYQALYNANTTTAGQSSFNTAVGDNALMTVSTGTNNSALGYNANVGTAALTNATAIGANAVAMHSNTVILGDSTHNVNVGIGTGAPATDAGLGIKGLHLEAMNGTVAASVAAQAGAGTSAAASFNANGGTDVGGGVSVTTGSGSYATGAQATVSFGKAYVSAPTVVLTPTDATSAAAMNGQQVYVSSTTSGFSINFGVAASAAATYNFNYFVIETK